MLFADDTRGKHFSKDPAVVFFNSRYFLYYSLPPFPGSNCWGIGIASSSDLETWTIEGEIKGTQACEAKGICAPGAIVIAGVLHLFYQTYGNGAKDAICHATSLDGIHFIKDASNPVYRPSQKWCCGRAIDADLCTLGDKVFLYFATRDFAFEKQMLGVATAHIASDFSRDAWTHACAAPILQPELDWEQKCIEAPATIVHEGKIYLFYGGAYNCSPQQIGCAVSQDGISFRRLSEQPFLKNGKEGTWNSSESGHPYVFSTPVGEDYLFFQGSNDHGNTWYISKARIVWNHQTPIIECEGER